MSEKSLFEKIAEGEIPSVKIREDDEFMAILDVFPNCKGQTLVIPKKRYDSDIISMPEDIYGRFMLATKHVMELLKTGLGVSRVGLIIEGMGVNHAHAKLYPMFGLGDEWAPIVSVEKVRFDTYDGHLTTQMGEMKSIESLQKLAEEILSQK